MSSPASSVLFRGSDFSSPRLASLPSLGGSTLAPLDFRSRYPWAPRASGRGSFLTRCPHRHLSGGENEISQVPGGPLRTCPDLRPRRTSDPSPWRGQRCCLPLRKPRRLRKLFPFEALSRGLYAPCVRFAAGVTPGPRNTRFRPVASLGRSRALTCWVPIEGFRHFPTCLPPSPGLAWRNFR